MNDIAPAKKEGAQQASTTVGLGLHDLEHEPPTTTEGSDAAADENESSSKEAYYERYQVSQIPPLRGENHPKNKATNSAIPMEKKIQSNRGKREEMSDDRVALSLNNYLGKGGIFEKDDELALSLNSYLGKGGTFEKDDNELIYEEEDDDISLGNSSKGIQSSYIQSLIQKQEHKGDWNSSIETIDTIDADMVTSPDDTACNEGEDSFLDVAIQPSGYERSVARLAFQGLKRMNEDTMVSTTTGQLNNNLLQFSLAPPKPARRALSSHSLVSMLKIQSISEHNELHDDIAKYNLAETVQIDAPTIEDDDEEDNVSEFTDDGDGDDDGNNTLDISIGSHREGGTFLPFQQQPIVNIQKSNMSHHPHRIEEASETSTFYLQSIASAENLTHVSDAPDYDYYSISSSGDDDEDDSISSTNHGENNHPDLIESAKAASSTKKPRGEAKLREDRSSETGKVSSAKKPPPCGETHQQTAQTATTAAVNPNAEKLSHEVCQVLGLPGDNLRKVHRGIMSRNTELQLRSMVGKAKRHNNKMEPDNEIGSNLRKMVGTAKRRNGELNVGMLKNENGSTLDVAPTPKSRNPNSYSDAMIEEHSDSSSSSGISSADSSNDLEFGGPSQSHKRKGKIDKWESIRLQRQNSRELVKRSRSEGCLVSMDQHQSNGGDADEKDRTNNKAVMISDDSGNKRNESKKQTKDRNSAVPTVNNDNEAPQGIQTRLPKIHHDAELDTDSVLSTSVLSTSVLSTSTIQVGDVKSRLGDRCSRLSQEKLDHESLPSEESDDEDSSDDDNEEEEGPTWDMNILTEGEYYLAMSMLVYIYALLRETSMLGHTDISFDEIDVNSFQSDPGFSGSVSSVTGNKFLSKTKSAGFIIRVVMDELEKKGAFTSVAKNEGDMSVLKEFKQWVNDSRSKQLDAATEQTIKELKRKVARKRWRHAIHMVRRMVRGVRLGYSGSNGFSLHLVADQQKSVKRRASTTMGSLRDSMTGSTDDLFKSSVKRRSITGSIDDLAKALTKVPRRMSSQALSFLSNQQQDKLVGESESEIKEIINDTLEEPRFFIEGSLLSNLIESGIEVVYFGDRHPNDVVYSICCNRQYKRVSVVFRGTVNSHNWLMNMKFAMTEHPNPITEDYPGRDNTVGLHTGFSLYLTRQRKDDSLTKIEEIFSNIDSIGRELAPDGDYELSITGHSLGGALATILSFYAATSSVFARVKTIRVFTFAAPRVGCQRFVHAFQHLERIGKLRKARFTNTRDLVPLVPFHGMSRSYKHVGMHIRLHGVDKFAQYWLRQALDVTYPKHHGLWSQICRGLRSSFIRNLDSLQGFKRNHTLSEYQHRIRFALEYRSILAQAGFFQSRKCSRLKTLEEYYFIEGASNLTCTGELTTISLEDRPKESVRRGARKLIIILALIALLEAVFLVSVLKKSTPCENYPFLLYPLYLLTGCRGMEENTASTMAHGVAEIPDVLQQDSTSTLPLNTPRNNQMAHEVAEIPDFSQQNFTSTLPQKTPANNQANYKLEKKTWSRTSLWMKWLWNTSHSSHMRPPCVWGHCNFPSRPYLPWGVRMQQTLPATIDYWSFDPSDSQQGLSWDGDILFRQEDIHFKVSEMILAGSRRDPVAET